MNAAYGDQSPSRMSGVLFVFVKLHLSNIQSGVGNDKVSREREKNRLYVQRNTELVS